MHQQARWGILGAAKIAVNQIIPAFRSTTRSRLVAIAARDRSRAEATGIARVHDSYAALLADPDIDIVYNPLPNHLHAAWTIRALDAGKHVLCEKPIALTALEARSIKQAEERSGRRAAEAFMVRYHPQWLQARALIAADRIGRIGSIQAFFAYFNRDAGNIRNDPRLGGGALYDIGCYAILLARFLFDANPERALGLFDRDPDFGIDRMTSGLLAFPGGRHLAFTCSTQLVRTQWAIVCGEKGRLDLPLPFNPSRERPVRLELDDCRDLFGAGAETVTLPPADHYALQCDAFSAAVLDGTALAYGIDDAIANMRVIDALFRSEGSGQWEGV